MRKVLKHELQDYLARHTSRRRNPVILALDKLAVGEAVEFGKDEHRKRTYFASFVGASFYKTQKRFSVRQLPDKSGWAVLRLK